MIKGRMESCPPFSLDGITDCPVGLKSLELVLEVKSDMEKLIDEDAMAPDVNVGVGVEVVIKGASKFVEVD